MVTVNALSRSAGAEVDFSGPAAKCLTVQTNAAVTGSAQNMDFVSAQVCGKVLPVMKSRVKKAVVPIEDVQTKANAIDRQGCVFANSGGWEAIAP